MNIPKYIDEALKRRTRYAKLLMQASSIVDNFIIKNGIENDIDSSDWLTGCEIYVNPDASENAVRTAILSFHE